MMAIARKGGPAAAQEKTVLDAVGAVDMQERTATIELPVAHARKIDNRASATARNRHAIGAVHREQDWRPRRTAQRRVVDAFGIRPGMQYQRAPDAIGEAAQGAIDGQFGIARASGTPRLRGGTGDAIGARFGHMPGGRPGWESQHADKQRSQEPRAKPHGRRSFLYWQTPCGRPPAPWVIDDVFPWLKQSSC